MWNWSTCLPAGALNVGVPPFPTFAGEACTVTSSVPEPGGVPHAEVRCDVPSPSGPGESESLTVKVFVSGDVCGEITNVVDVEGANEPAANVGPDNHAEATDQIACVPRIRLQKGGPERAHVGDTITYVFTVTNTGGVDLSNIDLSDPKCDAVTHADGRRGRGRRPRGRARSGPSSANTRSPRVTATPSTTWRRSAAITRAAPSRTRTRMTSTCSTPISTSRRPRRPTSGPAGTLIVYTYTVTNTGDTPLFDISVDDDMVGHVGDIATLPVGGTAELTSEITLGSSPITNIATAGGADAPRRVRQRRRRRDRHRGGRRRRRDRNGRKPVHRIRDGRPRRVDRRPRGPRVDPPGHVPETLRPPGDEASKYLDEHDLSTEIAPRTGLCPLRYRVSVLRNPAASSTI